MKRHKTALLVALAVCLLTAAVPAAATPNETSTDTPTTTTTPENDSDGNTTSTPTETPTTTPEDDGDDTVHVDAGNDDSDSSTGGIDVNIGGNDGDKIDTSETAYTVGPEITIHNVEYRAEQDILVVDLTVHRPGGAEIAYLDLAGAKSSKGDTGGKIPTVTVEGTERLKIPAGQYEGKSRVMLSGLGYYQTVTADAPGEPWFGGTYTGTQFWATTIGMAFVGAVGMGYVIHRDRRKQRKEVEVK